MIDYVRVQLPYVEVLAQLAEEAAELSHAALKMRRVIDGRNPTPVSFSQALDNLAEEVVDVLLCAQVLGFKVELHDPELDASMRAKLTRWVERLKAAGMEVPRDGEN